MALVVKFIRAILKFLLTPEAKGIFVFGNNDREIKFRGEVWNCADVI